MAAILLKTEVVFWHSTILCWVGILVDNSLEYFTALLFDVHMPYER